MRFFNKKDKVSEYVNLDPKRELIQSVLRAFQYKGHFYSSSISDDRFNELTTSNTHSKASNSELAAVKERLAANFRREIRDINPDDYSLDTLKEHISELISDCEVNSHNARTYTKYHYNPGRWDYVHGLEQEYIEPSSYTSTHHSHNSGKFEQYLTAVQTTLDSFHNDYSSEHSI